jgi:hypothetical protein
MLNYAAIGGFQVGSRYLCSTEASQNQAYNRKTDGIEGTADKNALYRLVRAVRYF